MNALIIFAVIFMVTGLVAKLSQIERRTRYKMANRGSRAVELEEWKKWSRKLFAEYKALAKLKADCPVVTLTCERFEQTYYCIFKQYRDTKALEVLRVRHNLPSDDEIYTMQEYMYSTKIQDRPPNYTSLAYLIDQCVFRAVNERGLKYGGTDYEEPEKICKQWEDVSKKHPWLRNDPTQR